MMTINIVMFITIIIVIVIIIIIIITKRDTEGRLQYGVCFRLVAIATDTVQILRGDDKTKA